VSGSGLLKSGVVCQEAAEWARRLELRHEGGRLERVGAVAVSQRFAVPCRRPARRELVRA
jgi:hypothetical protein